MNSSEKVLWDKSKIDTSDLYDMEYWSCLWKTTKEEILESIRITGSNNTEMIRRFLALKLSKVA